MAGDTAAAVRSGCWLAAVALVERFPRPRRGGPGGAPSWIPGRRRWGAARAAAEKWPARYEVDLVLRASPSGQAPVAPIRAVLLDPLGRIDRSRPLPRPHAPTAFPARPVPAAPRPEPRRGRVLYFAPPAAGAGVERQRRGHSRPGAGVRTRGRWSAQAAELFAAAPESRSQLGRDRCVSIGPFPDPGRHACGDEPHHAAGRAHPVPRGARHAVARLLVYLPALPSREQAWRASCRQRVCATTTWSPPATSRTPSRSACSATRLTPSGAGARLVLGFDPQLIQRTEDLPVYWWTTPTTRSSRSTGAPAAGPHRSARADASAVLTPR